MNQLPPWALRVQAAFLGIGVLLTVLAFQSGVPVPESWIGFFTQDTWDVLAQVFMSIVTAFQVIRSIFAASPKSPGVAALSSGRVNAFVYNPFKIAP